MCVCGWIFLPPSLRSIHPFSKLCLLFMVTGFWNLSQQPMGKRQVASGHFVSPSRALQFPVHVTCMYSNRGRCRPWENLPFSFSFLLSSLSQQKGVGQSGSTKDYRALTARVDRDKKLLFQLSSPGLGWKSPINFLRRQCYKTESWSTSAAWMGMTV